MSNSPLPGPDWAYGFIDGGDGKGRRLFVVGNGEPIPEEAKDQDLIFELGPFCSHDPTNPQFTVDDPDATGNVESCAVDDDRRLIYQCSGFSDTFATVDISDPADPVMLNEETGTVQSEAKLLYFPSIEVVGTVDMNAYDAFVTIDVSDPENPSVLGTGGARTNYRTGRLDADYDNLLAYRSSGIEDLSDPSNPSQIASLGEGDDLRAAGLNDDNTYVATDYYDGTDFGFHVYDVTDPANPALQSSTALAVNNNVGDVHWDGDVVYVGDMDSGNVMSYDVSDPTAPSHLDTVQVQGDAQSFVMQNGYLYVCENGGNVSVIDTAEPANLAIVGRAETGYNGFSHITFDPTTNLKWIGERNDGRLLGLC